MEKAPCFNCNVINSKNKTIPGGPIRVHIGLNHKENNFKKSEFLDSMDSLKSNLDKHTILSEKKRKKIGQNDEIRTPVNLYWLRCWAYFTTVMTKNLTITQIPHISAHFNLYHVKGHQKLS